MTDPLHPNTPAASGSDCENLRDARLARALQHMPDAHMQPSAQLRQAVLQQALRAVAQEEITPATAPTVVRFEWQRWWRASGQRGPWSAALVSVVLAGFISALWYGQDVPDATPERSPAAQRKAEPASAETHEAAASRSAVLGEANVIPAAPAAATAEGRVAVATASGTVPPAQSGRVAPVVEPGAPQGADAAPWLAATSAVAPAADPALAAPPASPTGTAPAGVPAPVAAEVAAAPAPAVADAVRAANEVATVSQRSRADAKVALAPDTRALPTLVADGVSRRAQPEQARALLALLRGLLYAPVPERAVGASNRITLVVEIAGVERWMVAADTVVYQRLDGGQSVYATLSSAQYATVQRLVHTP